MKRLFLFIALLSGVLILAACSAANLIPGETQTTPTTSTTPTTANTWQPVSTPSAATHINYFTVDSSNRWFIADYLSGFFMSLDQGKTWTNIGLMNPADWTINVDPANGDLIVGTVGPSGPNATPKPTAAYYRSTDVGVTWTKISAPFTVNQPALSGCVFASNNNMLCGGRWAPYPSSGLWVSTNGGVTTTAGLLAGPIPICITGGSVYTIALNPFDDSLWFGTEQCGAFRSTDNGFHWTEATPADLQIDPVKGIRDGNLVSFTFDNVGNVLFCAQGGIFKSSGSGPFTWTNVKRNGNTASGRVLGKDGAGNLYYTHNPDPLDPHVIFRSTDQGITWQPFDAGIPTTPAVLTHQFFHNPHDGNMYAVIEAASNSRNTPPGQLYVLR